MPNGRKSNTCESPPKEATGMPVAHTATSSHARQSASYRPWDSCDAPPASIGTHDHREEATEAKRTLYSQSTVRCQRLNITRTVTCASCAPRDAPRPYATKKRQIGWQCRTKHLAPCRELLITQTAIVVVSPDDEVCRHALLEAAESGTPTATADKAMTRQSVHKRMLLTSTGGTMYWVLIIGDDKHWVERHRPIRLRELRARGYPSACRMPHHLGSQAPECEPSCRPPRDPLDNRHPTLAFTSSATKFDKARSKTFHRDVLP